MLSSASNHQTFWVQIRTPDFWAPLLFSGFFFIQLIYTPLNEIPFLVVGLIYTAFLVVYYHLHFSSKEQAPLFIVALVLLSCIGTIFVSSANVFYGFATFHAGYFFSKKNALLSSAAIVLCALISARVLNLWHAWHILPGLIPAISLTFIGMMVRQAEQHSTKEKRSEQEKRQLIEVAERERIARDLHDTLGHTLTSISLKAQLAEKLSQSGDIDNARAEIKEVAEIASSTLKEVRDVVNGYQATGLKEHLKRLTEKLRHAGFVVHATEQPPKLAPLPETTLILILTEAVTNILRHSKQSKEVEILFKESDNNDLSLTIYSTESVTKFIEGNGISGMRKRLQEVEGQLKIDTSEGFKLKISLNPILSK